jgi:hypothetical protein
MVGQGPGPGVPYTEAPAAPPDIMRVRRQLEERVRRGAAEDVVQGVLVAADEPPQLLGSGAADMPGGDRPQCLPPVCEPGCGVAAMTRGATAVAAGVVDVVVLTPMIALQQRPTSGLRPAPEPIIPGAAMAGQEVRAAPLPLGRAIAP